MTQKEASEALGELFITGFSGLELTENFVQWVSRSQIGGTILFAHNYENPAQLAELIHQIQECRTELPLWISVDQEGGRVQRFKKGFTRIPDAATVGSFRSPQIAFEISAVIAKELKGVGVNLNFCPVGDILTHAKNPVIGNRAYGSNPDLVSKICTAVIRGHLVHQVQPCMKHFPGHGDTSVDSHFALPKTDTPLSVLKERELKPFLKAFRSKCSMVMVAHILNTKIDSTYPGTLSRILLQDLLRNELGYDKLILSDDMEMKAITDHFGVDEAPVLALQAGCDLLIYRSQAQAEHAYSACIHAIEKGKLHPEIILKACERIRALKQKCLLPYHPIVIAEVGKSVGTPENLATVQKLESVA